MSHLDFSQGKFLLTFDTELAWGTKDQQRYRRHYDQTRTVIKSVLKLCDEFDIPATWAVVGHLFLDNCNADHPELVQPDYSEDLWLDIDPGTDAQTDPHWYAPDIVDMICARPTVHEIASHTFTHVLVKNGCSEQCFVSEITACQKVAAERDITLRSLVYPQNLIGYTEILAQNGIVAYRGIDEQWYQGYGGFLRKACHVVDNYLCLPTRAVMPQPQDKIWNIPGSYFYPHADGWAKLLPVSFRVKKALSGIKRAMAQQQVFHLWTHPFNLASNPERLLKGLRQIFSFVSEQRSQGRLSVQTMSELGNELSKQ